MNYVEEVRQELKKHIKVNDRLLNLYALLVLTKGKNVTFKDVHDAWALDQNKTFPEHWSIVPFNQLKHEVMMKDKKYVDVIKKVAIKFNKGGSDE